MSVYYGGVKNVKIWILGYLAVSLYLKGERPQSFLLYFLIINNFTHEKLKRNHRSKKR